MSQHTIRLADLNDAYNIALLMDQIFRDELFEDVFNHVCDVIYKCPDFNFVAIDKTNNIIGFIMNGWNTPDTGPKEISEYVKNQKQDVLNIVALGVINEHRKSGVGKKLLETAIDLAKNVIGTNQLMLQVRKSNDPAFKLYEKNDFKIITTLPNYYTNPVEDGWLMIKTL